MMKYIEDTDGVFTLVHGTKAQALAFEITADREVEIREHAYAPSNEDIMASDLRSEYKKYMTGASKPHYMLRAVLRLNEFSENGDWTWPEFQYKDVTHGQDVPSEVADFLSRQVEKAIKELHDCGKFEHCFVKAAVNFYKTMIACDEHGIQYRQDQIERLEQEITEKEEAIRTYRDKLRENMKIIKEYTRL